MKKLKWLFVAITAISLLVTGCANSSGEEASPDVAPGTIGTTDDKLLDAASINSTLNSTDVVLFYYRADGNYSAYGLWLWTGAGSGQAGYDATAGKASTQVVNGVTIGYWNISTLVSDASIQAVISAQKDLNFIIRNASWGKDPGIDQKMVLSTGSRFMVLSGDTTVYTISSDIAPTITSALSTATNKIKVSLSVTLALQTEASDNGFIITADDGSTIAVTDAVNYDSQNNRYHNNTKNILLTLASDVDTTKIYSVSRNGFLPDSGTKITLLGAVKEASSYDGTDLGLTLDGTKATFKVWAPMASDVKLLVYSSVADVGTFSAASIAAKAVGATTDTTLYGTPAVKPIGMTHDAATGVWTASIADVSAYKYYKYQIINSGTTYYVCDTYAKAASADAVAAQITDINSSTSGAVPSSTTDTAYGTQAGYYNPFGSSGSVKKAYTDAVIYEMHVTDWSYAEDTTVGNVGKYLAIANGTKVISHLKDLGITHVQILPVFEFAETNANTGYNWGYNPYHYNVPEGRYVTATYEDGTQAVLELRTLIAKLHEAGIAVNMDVVYNHTNGTGAGSLYDSQVPYYFYRFDASGAYSNGSGCGNEIDTEAPMAKKYIIESLKHWMLDYHFNGFRFDLMGCIDKSTMKDIYDALYTIDPNVMVYGEPWTGGTAGVKDGATQAVSTSTGYGAGAFDDDFRDAIKGAEYGGFKQGQVQGTFNDSSICTGLVGNYGSNKRNTTGILGLGLHYVECHDNYTLLDKLAISYWQRVNSQTKTTKGDMFAQIGTEGLPEVKAEDTLAGAFVLLSQGTAFMNGGQDFLRTKRGNDNSYTSTTAINGIDLSFATTYSDVYNTYKGLIALRKANSASFGGNTSAAASTPVTGVTKYTTGDFLVYFNATATSYTIDTTGYTTVVDVTSGTPTTSTTLPTAVAAKSFVILKK